MTDYTPVTVATVLVLEDEPTLLDLIAEMLTLKGLEVTPTSTVEDARAELDKTIFDLLLTDVVVQGEFSGASLGREAQLTGRARRVVMMSGHPRQRALDGNDDAEELRFLKKPFSYEDLLSAVGLVE